MRFRIVPVLIGILTATGASGVGCGSEFRTEEGNSCSDKGPSSCPGGGEGGESEGGTGQGGISTGGRSTGGSAGQISTGGDAGEPAGGGTTNGGGGSGASGRGGSGAESTGGSVGGAGAAGIAGRGESGGGGGSGSGMGGKGGSGAAGQSGSGGSGSGAGGMGGFGACPDNTMVSLPQGYCIDRSEVTRSAYEAWLATTPVTTGQSASCTWNSSFAPTVDCMNGAGVCAGAGCAGHPQVCVDWCDAVAYCKAKGKRLCGEVGGGATPYDAFDEVTSQWFNACSSHGVNTLPYGETYDAAACNDDGTTTVATGSLARCASTVAGYGGVYDLNGNVWEWEDSCSSAQPDSTCRFRGGSYVDFGYNTPCAGNGGAARATAVANVGFRCCSDP